MLFTLMIHAIAGYADNIEKSRNVLVSIGKLKPCN